jgi:hypothetical protein
MNTVVIEHVALNELPPAWQARLSSTFKTRVTVRIEEEIEQDETTITTQTLTDNPLFGLWKDREEIADVSAYARQLRAPRYTINHNDDTNNSKGK